MGLNFADFDFVGLLPRRLPPFTPEVAVAPLGVFCFLFPCAIDKVLAVRLNGQRFCFVGLF